MPGCQLKEHAIEIVAYILLGHGKGAAVQQRFELTLRHSDLYRAFLFLCIGEVGSGEAGQTEAAATRLDLNLLSLLGNLDLSPFGQGFRSEERRVGKEKRYWEWSISEE